MAESDRKKPKKPAVPSPRGDTLRNEIAAFLEGRSLTARDISAELGIPERDVPDHLGHLRLSLPRRGKRLETSPAECRKCGYVFRKRRRLTRPGRCPVCKGTSIEEPRFTVK